MEQKKMQEKSLFSALSDIEDIAVRLDWVTSTMTLIVDEFEEALPEKRDDSYFKSETFANRMRLLASALHLAWNNLYDYSSELSTVTQTAFESYQAEKGESTHG